MELPLVYLQPDREQGTFLPRRERIPIGLLRVNLYKFITHFAKYLSKLLRRMSSCWLRLIKKRLHLKADGSFTLPADK